MMYKCLSLLTVLAVQQTVAYHSGYGENECVCQQDVAIELAAVKAGMQGRVDTLQRQLNYWQNVTINILKDLHLSGNAGRYVSQQEMAMELATVKADLQGQVDMLRSQLNHWLNLKDSSNSDTVSSGDTVLNGDCEVGDTTLELSVLNDITETNKETNERLERLQSSVHQLQGAVEQLQEDGCNAMTGSFQNPARNCSHIAYNNPNATSGYYWLQSGPGYAVQVYCDMERVCGCDEGRRERGGWMRVADIDMTRQEENCPTRFREVTSYGKRMCGSRNSGCVSTSFSSHGFEYSRVCGRIIGYQFGRTNAFNAYHSRLDVAPGFADFGSGFRMYLKHQTSIDSNFLDGFVLTYGSPRYHIWSFVAGSNQYRSDPLGCRCNSDSPEGTIPRYVQNDYFCDSGNRYNTDPSRIHYVNDPLWDGAGCVQGSCCEFNSPPWFCKDLPHPTSEDIELRLCLDGNTSNKDTPFEVVEIYIQ